MKSNLHFETQEDYWQYIHTKCAIATVCVLLAKSHWTNYKETSIEAVKVADELVKILKKKHK